VAQKSTSSSAGAKVTRIKAVDDSSSKKPVKAETTQKVATLAGPKEAKHNWFVRAILGIGGYFKGAWIELRNVRWPSRRATWGLTGAVIAFCAFFIIVILLLDALFKYVFELILK
jgi:preprotein translocase SecE subunit